MIDLGKRNYLLFDGDCGICSYSAEWAKKQDRSGEFIIEPYQRFPEHELIRLGLTYEDCAREVQVVSGRGRVYGGAIAVNYFLLKRFPWMLLVILIYAIPALLLLEVIGYRLVARNRHRVSRWLGLKACLLKN